jgi:Flp pilus assembly protein TadG
MRQARTTGQMRGRAGRRRSRAQALVEFATFFVAIMFLLAGMVDIGGLLDDHVNIVYAARQGARTAAVMGQNASADCAIIGAVNAAMANVPNVQVTRIIIYKSDANGAPMLNSSNQPIENAYATGVTCTVSGGTGTLNQTPSPNNYPATSRNNALFTEDSIGVEVDYNYTFRLPFAPMNLGNSSFFAYDRAIQPVNPITVPTPGGGTPTPTPTSAGPVPTVCPTVVGPPIGC